MADKFLVPIMRDSDVICYYCNAGTQYNMAQKYVTRTKHEEMK